MIFKVEMTVDIPHQLDEATIEGLKREEKACACQLQEEGVWRHLWRVAGEYKNVSIFDVASIDHLHQILTSLPLFPYMKIEVAALCRHPSSIKENDQ